MKTTDGHEIEKNNYYYLENGQEVILNDYATTPNGKDVFLVTPFYEGETMEVSGDGGYHHEISMNYEHEGPETLVYSVFKNAPLEKLDEKYKAKLMEIEALALTIGRMLSFAKEAKTKNVNLKQETEDLKVLFSNENEKLAIIHTDLAEVMDELSVRRQTLSELQDSISDLKSEDVSSMVSKTELQRLNKRDFMLTCLENGGVDNWEWWGESLKDYRKRYPED